MLKVSLEERKNFIAEAATGIFVEKGYKSATLQEIAQVVGVTKAGIYHYFKSKEDILYHILMTEHNSNLKSFRKFISSEQNLKLSPQDALKRMLRFHAQVTLKNRKIPLLSLKDRHQLTGNHRETYIKKEKEIFQTIKEAILTIPNIKGKYDINGIIFMIISMNVWIGYWLKDSGKKSLEDIIEQNIDILCHGLLE